jgi:hypothetical protein
MFNWINAEADRLWMTTQNSPWELAPSCLTMLQRLTHSILTDSFQWGAASISKPEIVLKQNSVAWLRERTIPAERPPIVGEVCYMRIEECRVVSVTDPYGFNLSFLDRSRYFFFQVALQLHSRGWVDPVPDQLLLRKSDSTGNRTRISGSVARNSDH